MGPAPLVSRHLGCQTRDGGNDGVEIRDRFVALDGLRGVAAFGVLLYHLRLILGTAGFFAHAYLAVDFFFLLSGFVLAHAYGERLTGLRAIPAFLRDRVIRLHPLIWPALVPSTALLILGMHFGKFTLVHPALAVLVALVPFPAFWEGSRLKQQYALNGATWSLFWELVANLAFALIAPFLGTRRLAMLTVLLVGSSVAVSLTHGGLAQVEVTAPFRSLSCFFLGVLLLRAHRGNWIDLAGWGRFAMPVLILCLALPAPSSEAAVLDPLLTFMVFPLVLLAAARWDARFVRTCAWLGALSYPLYVLQAPVIQSVRFLPILGIALPKFAQGALALALCPPVAWLALKLFDEPVRAALRRRFGSRGHRTDLAEAVSSG